MKTKTPFSMKERGLIKKEITAYAAKQGYKAPDVNKYFDTFIQVITLGKGLPFYLKHARKLIDSKSALSPEEQKAKVYGREAYMVGRLVEEGRKVELFEHGGILLDGEFIKGEYSFPKAGEFVDEDEDALPNIDSEYYSE